MMTTREILKAGRALIADPKRWCQRFSAIRADGSACAHDDPLAVRWCSAGALTKVMPRRWGRDEIVYRNNAGLALSAACGNNLGITTFNDTHTHAEVLAAWDRAIARMEST